MFGMGIEDLIARERAARGGPSGYGPARGPWAPGKAPVAYHGRPNLPAPAAPATPPSFPWRRIDDRSEWDWRQKLEMFGNYLTNFGAGLADQRPGEGWGGGLSRGLQAGNAALRQSRDDMRERNINSYLEKRAAEDPENAHLWLAATGDGGSLLAQYMMQMDRNQAVRDAFGPDLYKANLNAAVAREGIAARRGIVDTQERGAGDRLGASLKSQEGIVGAQLKHGAEQGDANRQVQLHGIDTGAATTARGQDISAQTTVAVEGMRGLSRQTEQVNRQEFEDQQRQRREKFEESMLLSRQRHDATQREDEREWRTDERKGSQWHDLNRTRFADKLRRRREDTQHVRNLERDAAGYDARLSQIDRQGSVQAGLAAQDHGYNTLGREDAQAHDVTMYDRRAGHERDMQYEGQRHQAGLAILREAGMDTRQGKQLSHDARQRAADREVREYQSYLESTNQEPLTQAQLGDLREVFHARARFSGLVAEHGWGKREIQEIISHEEGLGALPDPAKAEAWQAWKKASTTPVGVQHDRTFEPFMGEVTGVGRQEANDARDRAYPEQGYGPATPPPAPPREGERPKLFIPGQTTPETGGLYRVRKGGVERNARWDGRRMVFLRD